MIDAIAVSILAVLVLASLLWSAYSLGEGAGYAKALRHRQVIDNLRRRQP